MKARLFKFQSLSVLVLVAILLSTAALAAGGENEKDLDDYDAQYGDSGDEPAEEEEGSEKEPDSHIPGVIELDDLTFDKIVGGQHNVFVEFYAPWCGHCKAMVKELTEAAAELGATSNILIAKVNGDDSKELADRFKIEGFPTFKFFPKGSPQGQDYDGERTAEGIVKFLKEGDTKGTVLKLEGLVKAFLEQSAERASVLSSTKEAVQELEGEEAKYGAYYIKVMSRALKDGVDYISKEKDRLLRLMQAGGLKKEKHGEFKERLAVLKVFHDLAEL